MLVYVARHGEATHNLQDLFHDTTVPDVPLTAKGRKQAEGLADRLKDAKLDVIYASELQRTQQTAAIVNTVHNAPTIIDPLLNDIVSGIAGHPVSEFRELLAGSIDPWNARFSGGESYEDNKSRATAFLQYLKDQPYQCVLIVTSGGVANMLYGYAHGLSNDQMYKRPIENAALLSFELEN